MCHAMLRESLLRKSGIMAYIFFEHIYMWIVYFFIANRIEAHPIPTQDPSSLIQCSRDSLHNS
jgi:hypothetical protein